MRRDRSNLTYQPRHYEPEPVPAGVCVGSPFKGKLSGVYLMGGLHVSVICSMELNGSFDCGRINEFLNGLNGKDVILSIEPLPAEGVAA